jgi:Restriction Enzyme Adenine Methylase Associated
VPLYAPSAAVSIETGSASSPDEPKAAELEAVLREVGERIERHRGTHIGEQNTKLALINPVLRALGWNVEDLEDVRHEFRLVPADKPVDYALMLARSPRLFVEAKGLDEDLGDRRWANQIISYATVAGVEWVVLTNGDEYRIYNAHALVPVDDKLFRTVQISKHVNAAAEALVLLSKERTRDNSLTELWKAYSIDRRVREAVEALFMPEPSRWLVRRLANELDGLTLGDVKAALGRARITLDFPVGEVPRPSRGIPPDISVPGPPRKKGPRHIPKAVSAVSVKQLIEAGLIKPPLDLSRKYKGQILSARIESDGRVSCLGGTYDSVSVAAAMARRSVIGAPPGRKYPQTNGWTFWQFREGAGQLQELSVLRERLVAAAGQSSGSPVGGA